MRANVLPSVGLEHEAFDEARKAVELDPDFWFWLGWADLGLVLLLMCGMRGALFLTAAPRREGV